MRALVTGGTGFIGTHVVQTLVRHGVEVRVLVRTTSHWGTMADLPVKPVLGDVLDPVSLAEACRDVNLVMHAAADYRLWVPDPHRMYQVNVHGTDNVIQAAIRARVDRIVHTSSAVTVACRDDRPGTEEAFVQPDEGRSAYPRTKVIAEQTAWRWIRQGAPITIVNPSTVVGPMDRRPTPTGRLIVDYLSGRLPAYLDAALNWIDVRDVAEGHWLAATKGRAGERYLLSHQNLSLGEFLAVLAQVCGRSAPRWRVPYPVAFAAAWAAEVWSRYRGGEPRATREGVRMAAIPMRYDSGKAVQELGLPQTSIRTAAADAVRWFREHGHVNQGGGR
ncbi:MAG: hopanoid-associated sugar epimerase [Nitrospirales bacterium]